MIACGIIGSGNMAADMAKAFTEHGGFLIKSFCDLNEEKAKKMAQNYDCSYLSDYQKLLADPQIKAIYIATPPKTHAEIFERSILAKKHTLCEKPLCLSEAETKTMIKASKHAHAENIISAINYPMAFLPSFLAMKNLLKDLSTIRHVELKLHFPSWPRPGLNFSPDDWINTKDVGGILREISCHFLFALHELFPKTIKGIFSAISYPEKGAETGVSGTILHEGFSTNLSVAGNFAGQNEEIYLRIFGQKMSLSLENFQILKTSTGGPFVTHESSLNINEKAFMSSKPLVDHFYRAINGQEHQLTSIEVGAQVQRTLGALLEGANPKF